MTADLNHWECVRGDIFAGFVIFYRIFYGT